MVHKTATTVPRVPASTLIGKGAIIAVFSAAQTAGGAGCPSSSQGTGRVYNAALPDWWSTSYVDTPGIENDLIMYIVKVAGWLQIRLFSHIYLAKPFRVDFLCDNYSMIVP